MRKIRKRAWLLAVASGVLQVLVFPLPNLYFLCWIALAPLLVAILAPQQPLPVIDREGRDLSSTTVAQGFLLATLSGFIWWAGTCYWFYQVMRGYGGLPAPVAAGVFILTALCLATFHGLFGALLVAAGRRPPTGNIRTVALVPFLWVAVELARTRIAGIPWDLLGTAQVDNIPLARIAAVTGVYGVSFGIALVNAAFAAAFLLPRHRRQVMLAAATAAALALQAGVLAQPAPEPATHRARLVQTNVPILGGSAWTTNFYANTLNEFGKMSLERELDSPAPKLIVWPESPTPFFVSDPMFHHMVMGVAQRANGYVVAGSLGVRTPAQRGQEKMELLNSASVMGPKGDWVGRYDKVHLVPFGEYVPFQSLLVFVEKLTRESGDFRPGTERPAFTLDGHALGVFICYESVFPDEVRIFARNGAQVFINISNAPYQHLNMARMRAIENHRWVLRGTNTGITGSIDPYGRVVARAERNVRTTLDAPYGFNSGTTFYTRHGDLFAYACAIISVVALVVRFRFRAAILRS